MLLYVTDICGVDVFLLVWSISITGAHEAGKCEVQMQAVRGDLLA